MAFIDHMLDRLAGKGWYCFLDGYLGYNQISIAPEDQEKPLLIVLMELSRSRGCPSGCVIHQLLFRDI